MKLKEFNIDELNSCESREDRAEAKRRYAEWRDKQRKIDRKINKKESKKIYNFKNKEYRKEYFQRPEVKKYRKEYHKEYFQRPEVKERTKEYHKEYYQRKKLELLKENGKMS